MEYLITCYLFVEIPHKSFSASLEEKKLNMFKRKSWQLILLLVSLLFSLAIGEDVSFTYNGFHSANLTLDGIAQITSNNVLMLTNRTKQQTAHAFYPYPISFKNSTNGTVISFSTTFVFAIFPQTATLSAHGIAFVIAPTRGLPGSLPSSYLGLFNETNNGNVDNRVVAVELDTIYNSDFGDINDNHVGIDINSLRSDTSRPAGYYDETSQQFIDLTLISSKKMQIWVDYDAENLLLNVTLAPIEAKKPKRPLLSLSRDLSKVLNEKMYVGFSSSTGSMLSSHFILGWSFKMNGQAQALNLSQLPKLPRIGGKKTATFLVIGLPVILISLVAIVIISMVYVARRNKAFAEVIEDWELDYGPQRFKYKDLYSATKGFRDKELLGKGGFGKVYKGLLSASKLEIAVKTVSHDSSQGVREFVAEIVTLGRLRHRNLVPLLGYCRRKKEMLLVYDYMPNRSLDKHLFDQPSPTLTWNQRFQIIKGVASGLLYLHEEWEQVVIHRDIKASNVLIDSEFNARLGDFGLARLYDHGTAPHTTHVVGTLGYLAPELYRTGKATKSTDVFAFGAFLLEVVCGRRPIESSKDDLVLVDRVFSFWMRGEILEARDMSLGTEFISEEVELVLKLGLLCSHPDAAARPSMRRIVQYLEGDVADLPSLSCFSLEIAYTDDFNGFTSLFSGQQFSGSTSPAESLLSGGR